jgi:hypothetical protein
VVDRPQPVFRIFKHFAKRWKEALRKKEGLEEKILEQIREDHRPMAQLDIPSWERLKIEESEYKMDQINQQRDSDKKFWENNWEKLPTSQRDCLHTANFFAEHHKSKVLLKTEYFNPPLNTLGYSRKRKIMQATSKDPISPTKSPWATLKMMPGIWVSQRIFPILSQDQPKGTMTGIPLATDTFRNHT